MTPKIPIDPASFSVHPLIPERWSDFETLFGPNGAYSGCWCMWWRLSRSEFSRLSAGERRLAMKALVDSGVRPGLLAYLDGAPAGWCSIGPRQGFASLERSTTLKRVDDQPVWSIVCFFVARPFRGRGVQTRLLAAALDYARGQGARIVEAYPVETGQKLPPVSSFMGLADSFRAAGFVEVARPSPRRPILRFTVSP